MSLPRRFAGLTGWILPLLIVGLVAWVHLNRLERIQQLTAVPDWSVAQPEISTRTATGFRDDTRRTVWAGGDFAIKRAVEVAQNPRADTGFSVAMFLRIADGSGIEKAALYFNSLCYLCLGVSAALVLTLLYGAHAGQLFTLFFFGAYPLIAAFVPGRVGMLELFSGFFSSGVYENNLLSWWRRDGFSSSFLATILPAVVLIPLVWKAWQTRSAPYTLSLFAGLALCAFMLAAWRIPFFALADLALAVALAVAASARKAVFASPEAASVKQPFSWWWLSTITLLPGLILVWPVARAQADGTFTPGEWQALVLRDLAHGLAAHYPHAVVLASPATSADLAYAGGLRTLINDKSHSAESVVRICESTTAEEAQRLLEAHQVRYLVFPSWDSFFRDAKTRDPRTFIEQLHRWNLPAWLRPTPYFLPAISGEANTRVIVFEIVPEQDEATAAANLVEYFLETNSLDRALQLGSVLDRFPTDLAAMTASVEIDIAQNPSAIAKGQIDAISDSIRANADENLPLDQCARLALDLARLSKDDLARAETIRCVEGFSPADVLASTPRALLRFMALCRYYHLQFKDASVEPLVWRLLPPGSREKIDRN